MRLRIVRTFDPSQPADQYPYQFRYDAQLEVTDEERELIERHGLRDTTLTYRRDLPSAKLGNLLDGYHENVRSAELLHNNERVLREALAEIPAALDYVRKFGQKLEFTY